MSGINEAVRIPDKQDGERLSEEMKDYAKSTMNELLGMFGYGEEITREAVEELQIKLLPEADENIQQMGSEPLQMEKDVSITGENQVLVQIPGVQNNNSLGLEPVPELDNAVTVVRRGTQNLVNIPSETIKEEHALEKATNKAASTSDLGDKKGVEITSSTALPGKPSRNCSWCKKSAPLKDITSCDGEKVISCKNVCSAECFEQTVKFIKESQSNEGSLQAQKLPGSIKTVKPGPSVPITRQASKGPPAVLKYLFSWDEYLAKTNSAAAPWSFFKQSSTPPYNGFQKNMKLEVADPRIVDIMCVATVVGILGPRIRCRFDGTDSANDVWHLVDSKQIHPVGWCEGNGGRLQPPVGFKLDPGKYSTFLAKTLANAELAPVRLFKREPAPPKGNLFKVGMKLEALDPKNPLLICVATVAGIDGEKIRVDFDGYLGSDYWCRYDSRDIFPVGWCHYSGHPLQPPGQTRKALKQSNVKTKEHLEKPTKPEKPEKQNKKKIPEISAVASVCAATAPAPTPTVTTSSNTRREPLTPDTSADALGTNHTVQVFINHSCVPGPFLDVAKVACLPSCFRGTVPNVARDCFQSIVNAGIEPANVFRVFKQGNGKTRITCKNGKQTLSCHLQVMDRVSRFWSVLDKLTENLQCCVNLFSGERIAGLCSKCGRNASRRNTVLPETLPVAAKKSSTPMAKRGAYKQRQGRAKRARITYDKGTPDDAEASSPTVDSTSPLKTWSVDEVVKFMEKSELAEHAGMFKEHEIDGKALLLLTREMIMSYMGLKLGPAIKLLDCIEELKTQKYT
ncbi:polycomb protein SCMH1-like isoform X1 [Acropora palmata]|uniref:polycomb protein SCMH1-like isoform X1 n=1 Tax=Acropora palmata TaxID=6131 RepID=UPI003DA13D45